MSNVNRAGEPDVFELILKSTGTKESSGQAEPSNFIFPENWQAEHQEGQLAVDVAQTEKELMVVSTLAGAEADKIEVFVHNDLLTIRGQRHSPLNQLSEVEHFHQECYWGKFSRTIVLPVDVKGDLAHAEYKNGVLTVTIPKKEINKKVPIVVVD